MSEKVSAGVDLDEIERWLGTEPRWESAAQWYALIAELRAARAMVRECFMRDADGMMCFKTHNSIPMATSRRQRTALADYDRLTGERQ